MKTVDIIIIGAGAAGLMCAIEAGKRGRSVLVLDSANKPGKKILMSGGGRCNFTNYNVTPDNFISHNPHFCKSALSRYTPYDFIKLVEQHNIPYHEKTLGQLFCDNKSKDILNMLLKECSAYPVEIELNANVSQIKKKSNSGFSLLNHQQKIHCQSLVIASGGLSIPTMGASPFGYQVAEQFNIKIWPTRAGLVPLTLHEAEKNKFSCLSGISVDSLVTTNGQQFRENILFTHRSLSGPSILQISSYWNAGDTVEINLLPDFDLFDLLLTAQNDRPPKQLNTFLSQYFAKRVVQKFLGDELADSILHTLSPQQLKKVAQCFQEWKIKPNGTEGYRTAEVTLGGVDCDAISSKTMEARTVPGLYFIGEVLDVTGWLGGYNFQWAWASAVAAGQCV